MSKIQVESIEATKTKEVSMKRRLLLPISLGLALMLAVVGLCGCSPSNTTLGTINLNSQQEGIWVSGMGEVTVTPDIAVLRLGIVAQEASVAEAQTKASEAMNKVMTALTDSGVAEKDIQTQYFSIRQIKEKLRVVEEFKEETEVVEIVVYRVSNMVVAKIRDTAKVGTIIDAVAEAGGDLTRIERIGFSIDDPSVYYEEAREKAMADAKAKAEQLAELAGVTLGKPTYVSEGAHIPRIYEEVYYEKAGGVPMPAPAPPPISPGETKITLTVQVAYSILQ